MLIVTQEAYNKLKPSTKEELLAAIFPAGGAADYDDDFYWDERIDLSLDQVTEFMRTLNEETTKGIRVLAEKGKVTANELTKAGIADVPSLQRSTTRRARTMTGNGDTFLLAWDDWENVEEGEGRYTVTPTTLRSLRTFFKID